MRRRLAILAFVFAVPFLSGCCCGYGGYGCGYRLFCRPCMFGPCGDGGCATGGCATGGCASGGCSSSYGGQAMQPAVSGYPAPTAPPAAMPNQPIPQLSSVPTANTVPTRIIR